MMAFTSHISVVFLLLFSAMTFHRSMCTNHYRREVRCNQKDRRILSIFKQGVTDPSNRLSSWSTEEDCCAWTGIQCHNITGRVTRLDLNFRGYNESETLQGEINLSLLELEFLNYLDLSGNDFESIRESLVTPSPLANFSNLHYLDLSYNADGIHMDNLHWLSQLSSLKYLNLSYIDLSKETNWLQSTAMHPSLSELRLSQCGLTNINPSLQYVNFSSLVTLDLSYNNFNSELPRWLFNLTNDISYLRLRESGLKGQVPTSLLNLRNLEYLDLSSNKLNGSIPDSLGQLESLQHLDLSYNELKGSIPDSLGESLQHLDLSDNELKGSIPDSLGQHERLQNLDLSYNLFYGPIPSTLGNLSSLIELDISSNLLSGNLPNSLGQLFHLETLRVGNNSLSGVLSETFFSKLPNLEELDFSSSAFEFDLDAHWNPPFQLSGAYLSNTVQGPNFPGWLYTQRSLASLDVSSSRISSIDGDKFWSFAAGIDSVDLSNNSIAGDISNVTLNSTSINLGHNKFTGRLPHISAKVGAVDVSHNSFSGALLDWRENWKDLYYINLRSNKLSGELPQDLSKSKELEFMDLGDNQFSGNLPTKMPESLQLMILRSNQFTGNIPSQLCKLGSLTILDLADNKLSGRIPWCVSNITVMVTGFVSDYMDFSRNEYSVFTKGLELEYTYDSLGRNIDLSSNNLSGEIPPELFTLVEVQSMNLSHNYLNGTISKSIGNMKNLESLDLSHNLLSGEIPQSMSGLSFLEYLNMSYNNFTGQIPLGTQLQTFEASSYIGNPELCGAPLPKNCTEEESHHKAKQHARNEDDSERESLYLGMGIGFALGFWGVCGSLFFNRAWRHTYFRFLGHVADRLYVAIAVKFNSL